MISLQKKRKIDEKGTFYVKKIGKIFTRKMCPLEKHLRIKCALWKNIHA